MYRQALPDLVVDPTVAVAILDRPLAEYHGGGTGDVPEIGPHSVASALTVLVGGSLILTGWRRKK